MIKSDYYDIYQNNINLLEKEMALTKKSIQILLGEKGYKNRINETCENIDLKILSGTRLYSFLMCSWFEARLYKVLYEGSGEGFAEDEIQIILGYNNKPLHQKWTDAYNFAICKKYGFVFQLNKNYKNDFSIADDSRSYKIVLDLLNDIEKAIQVRNKLAHGQWHTPLTRNRKHIATDIENYLNTYDNIQKLNYQHKNYKVIAEIIHDIVVSKSTYKRDFEEKIRKLKTNQQDIEKRDFRKYCRPFVKHELRKRNAKW